MRMSRKKHRKHKYSKAKFISKFCSRCRLCNTHVDPKYCYNVVYRTDPEVFVRKILPELIKLRGELNSAGHYDTTTCLGEDTHFIIENAFCRANYCCIKNNNGNKCSFIEDCVNEFEAQSTSRHGNKNWHRNAYKKEKCKKPVPEFFCNEGFSTE